MNKYTNLLMPRARRLNRLHYWVGMLTISNLSSILAIALLLITGSASLMLGVIFLAFVAWMNLLIRRVHDLDRSGWTILWPYAFIALMPAYVVLNPQAAQMGSDMVVVTSLALLGFFGFMAYFAFKRGTRGPNRFGDDPLPIAENDFKPGTLYVFLVLNLILSVILNTLSKAL